MRKERNPSMKKGKRGLKDLKLTPSLKKKILIAGAGLVLVLLFVQNCQLALLSSKAASDRRMVSLLSASLDQTREFLGLGSFSAELSGKKAETQTEEKSQDVAAFFNAIDFLDKTSNLNEQKKIYASFITLPLLSDFMSSYALTRKEAGVLKTELYNSKTTYLTCTLEENKSFKITSADGKSGQFDSPQKMTVQKILELYESSVSFVNSRKSIADQIVKSAKDAPFLDYLENNRLSIAAATDEGNFFSCRILDFNGKSTGEIRINKYSETVYVGTTEIKIKKFDSSLIFDAVKKGDFRASIDKLIEERISFFETLKTDKAFVAALKEKGFSLSKNKRQDEDYIYFDIEDTKSGTHKGAIALSVHTADFYLVDEKDIPVGSLEAVMEMSDEKTTDITVPDIIDGEKTGMLLEEINKDSDAILLCGRHEFDTDTMMVLYPNKKTGELILFGLPRDLYYNHAKINTYYKKYGANFFLQTVSEITGLNIKHYVVIDMYAFIDVVNLMGGVDIVLDRDIIDPTYRVVNNGVEETLYYPKGSYHLNGIETLRIVRSRHFSSDFSRSKRQQKVLMAMKDTIVDISQKDMPKVLGIMQKLITYIETDMNPVQLIGLFTRYKDYKMRSQYVIDNSNVLIEAWSNLHYGPNETVVPENSGITAKGLYILLPKDDNWSIIKWYVATLINGEEIS